MTDIAFIGTGNIAEAHAQAVAQIDGVKLVAVIDAVPGRAAGFARRHGVPRHYESLAEALSANELGDDEFTIAHVLTPPATHYPIAKELLGAGVGVYLEKPMAEEPAECAELCRLAREGGAPLRVNQNYIFHPAHLRATKALADRPIGPVKEISCRYHMPLRQLGARQFGHWMFDTPRNLLLEQVIHPLSLLDDLAGPLAVTSVTPGAIRDYADGVALVTDWAVMLEGAKGARVALSVSLGATMPEWTVAMTGTDGRADIDYLANSASVTRLGGYIDFLETLRGGLGQAGARAGQDVANAAGYLAAQAKLVKRNDPFFLSIRNAVADFYRALGNDKSDLDGARGARLVGLCADIAGKTPPLPARAKAVRREGFSPDVVVLGGTGFIGSYLTRDLVGAGQKVRVVARNTGNPARVFTHDNVELVRGSISDEGFLREAMAGVPVIVNLAHGGGGDDWPSIRKALVGGAETVAEAAIAAGAEKFLHVSSIAALYLGDPEQVITYQTPVDEKAAARADYARAKAEAEKRLLSLCRDKGLPLSLWRPGVVVGEGTSAFHSGIGFYNRERICLGWNAGMNPLPLVLAEDVAAAMLTAITRMPAEDLTGTAYNLVGDVRLTARDYTAALAEISGRPLVYRPQSLWQQQAGEVAKWLVKRAAGRKVGFPSMRDLRSRGLVSPFDTAAEKKALGWAPVNDRQVFIDKAFAAYKD